MLVFKASVARTIRTENHTRIPLLHKQQSGVSRVTQESEEGWAQLRQCTALPLGNSSSAPSSLRSKLSRFRRDIDRRNLLYLQERKKKERFHDVFRHETQRNTGAPAARSPATHSPPAPKAAIPGPQRSKPRPAAGAGSALRLAARPWGDGDWGRAAAPGVRGAAWRGVARGAARGRGGPSAAAARGGRRGAARPHCVARRRLPGPGRHLVPEGSAPRRRAAADAASSWGRPRRPEADAGSGRGAARGPARPPPPLLSPHRKSEARPRRAALPPPPHRQRGRAARAAPPAAAPWRSRMPRSRVRAAIRGDRAVVRFSLRAALKLAFKQHRHALRRNVDCCGLGAEEELRFRSGLREQRGGRGARMGRSVCRVVATCLEPGGFDCSQFVRQWTSESLRRSLLSLVAVPEVQQACRWSMGSVLMWAWKLSWARNSLFAK